MWEGRENIKDSLTDVRKRQKIKSQVANEVSTLAKIDQWDDPRYKIENSKCKTRKNGVLWVCLTCDTHSSGRVLSFISTSSHKVGMSWMKPQQSCCISKFYGKMKKMRFTIYSLLWNYFKVSMFLWVCVSKTAYVDMFTYCQIKRCVNICINRYSYSHPSILLYMMGFMWWVPHTELISLPDHNFLWPQTCE